MDIHKNIKELQQMYRDDPRKGTFNALVMGEPGTGKTFGIASTSPYPVFIDSFDKGGVLGLGEYIEAGKVVVDTRWEKEDPTKPHVFLEWAKVMEERINSGFFDHFKMYMLDSCTSFSNAIMNSILKKAGRAGKKPVWGEDYVPQKIIMLNWVEKLLLLPCHTIVTGHLIAVEGADKLNRFRLMATGDAKVRLPLLFDELWVTMVKSSGGKPDYRILTSPKGMYLARSRMSAGGKLDQDESLDVKAILKKVGFDYSDGELFK